MSWSGSSRFRRKDHVHFARYIRPAKNYKRVRYHQDRDLLDSELNEQQDIINNERRKLADILFKEGAIVSGFGVTVAANVLTVAEGLVYIDGCLERVPGAVLTYDRP